MTDTDLLPLIISQAPSAGVPIGLARGIILTESNGNPWAFRYESTYRWLAGTEAILTATERTGQMCSWGLMQIMGAVARGYGFKGYFPELCDPAINIQYGLQHLVHFHERYENWLDTIAAYNAGRAIKVNGQEKYANQTYVDKVQAYWTAYDGSTSV